jgi:hypothetical protein
MRTPVQLVGGQAFQVFARRLRFMVKLYPQRIDQFHFVILLVTPWYQKPDR